MGANNRQMLKNSKKSIQKLIHDSVGPVLQNIAVNLSKRKNHHIWYPDQKQGRIQGGRHIWVNTDKREK